MPHTKRVEALADEVAAIGAKVDERVAQHVADGSDLPTLAAIMLAIRPRIRRAVEDALDDIHPDWTARDAADMTDEILAELRVIVNRSLRDAVSRRKRVLKGAQIDLQTAPDRTKLLRRGLLLGVLVAGFRNRRKRDPDVLELRRLSIEAGQPMPNRVGPAMKQTVRTRVAEGRNRFAADIADRLGLVIRVGDGLRGPTDEDCMFVDGKYATPVWMRNHPVSHPNCTRIGRPAKLPAGQQVTLLE